MDEVQETAVQISLSTLTCCGGGSRSKFPTPPWRHESLALLKLQDLSISDLQVVKCTLDGIVAATRIDSGSPLD